MGFREDEGVGTDNLTTEPSAMLPLEYASRAAAARRGQSPFAAADSAKGDSPRGVHRFSVLLAAIFALAAAALPAIAAVQETSSPEANPYRPSDADTAPSAAAMAPMPPRPAVPAPEFRSVPTRTAYSAAPPQPTVRTAADWQTNRVAQAAQAPERVPPGPPGTAPGAAAAPQELPNPNAAPDARSLAVHQRHVSIPGAVATARFGYAETDAASGREIRRIRRTSRVAGKHAANRGRASEVLVFREPPRRVYIPREDIAEYQVITPTQLAVVGKKVGTAMLNLWFADPKTPNDTTKDHLLSY